MKPFFVTLMMTGLVGASLQVADDKADAGKTPEAIRSAVVPDGSQELDVVKEAKAAAAPVPVPPLTHYAALWERSMFTTLDLPAPETPQGPGFTDQLVLAGTYEVDGAVVAVILDKMSALVTEARIGSDNEMGVRIKSVEPGSEGSVRRIQLQKGMQSGWIQVAEVATTGSAGAPGSSSNPGDVPRQAIMPSGDGMNTEPRGPALPANPPPAAAMPPSVVQPLQAPTAPAAGSPAAATPNPNLDDIPLPPEGGFRPTLEILVTLPSGGAASLAASAACQLLI
jgi:hypothetical protein